MILLQLHRFYNKLTPSGPRISLLRRCYCSVKSAPKNQPPIPDYAKMMEELETRRRYKSQTVFNYLSAVVIFMGGAAFAFVPIFNAFCRVTDYGSAAKVELSRTRTKNLKRVEDMVLNINFNADKSSYLNWKFQPLQSEITVSPGETVLAFYSAENPSDKPISGISTYSVVPYEASKYFNKIQCFCFDEQRLNPHEQVDMPVFFFIDPDIINDPYLFGLSSITLSYTFFEAIPGLDLPFMSSFVEEE